MATNKRIQPRFKLVAGQVPEGDPRDLTLTVTRRSRTVRSCVCVSSSHSSVIHQQGAHEHLDGMGQ